MGRGDGLDWVEKGLWERGETHTALGWVLGSRDLSSLAPGAVFRIYLLWSQQVIEKVMAKVYSVTPPLVAGP